MIIIKYVILGQPRSGKSTLAKELSKEFNIPVICTDKYRREWGFHEPWKGYDTEISPDKQSSFYDKLLELYNSYEDVILEGSAINPKDINLFKNDGVVLLYRNLSNIEMLNQSREWTSRREDDYLLELFQNYINYAKKWVSENNDIAIDTTDFENGINKAKEILLNKFQREILKYENEENNELVSVRIGKYPVLLTSVHSILQLDKNDIKKLNEPFTKSIAKYVANVCDIGYVIKNIDDGNDSNHVEFDKYKNKLIDIINKEKIRLVIDIHGASEKRNFDVELGTLNNLSADFSTINELKESFIENGIKNIKINELFLGGKVTQSIFLCTNSEAVQLEINKRYRDIQNEKNLEQLCNSLIKFIKKYIETE